MARSSFEIADENLRRLEQEAGNIFASAGSFGIRRKRFSGNPAGRKREANEQFRIGSAAIPAYIAQKQQHEMNMALEAQKLQNKGSLAEAKVRGQSAMDVAKANLKFEREKLAEEKALIQSLQSTDPTLTGEVQNVVNSVPGMFQTSGGKSGLLGDMAGILGDNSIWQTAGGTYTNKPETEIPKSLGGTSTGVASYPPGFKPPRKPRASLTTYERYMGAPLAGTINLGKQSYGAYQKYVGIPFERLVKNLNDVIFPSYIE